MTKLIAFAIIGGKNSQPISKSLLAETPEPGDSAYDRTRYIFSVVKHEGHFDFLPTDEAETLYAESFGSDLELALETFEACKDTKTVRDWQHDRVETRGEHALWARV